MVEKSTGDLSRARHVDELSDGRQPFYNGTTLVLLDAPRASGAAWCTAAPGLRPQPCTNCMTKPCRRIAKSAQVYIEFKSPRKFIVADRPATWRSPVWSDSAASSKPRATLSTAPTRGVAMRCRSY